MAVHRTLRLAVGLLAVHRTPQLAAGRLAGQRTLRWAVVVVYRLGMFAVGGSSYCRNPEFNVRTINHTIRKYFNAEKIDCYNLYVMKAEIVLEGCWQNSELTK